jgi:hypothetical protein
MRKHQSSNKNKMIVIREVSNSGEDLPKPGNTLPTSNKWQNKRQEEERVNKLGAILCVTAIGAAIVLFYFSFQSDKVGPDPAWLVKEKLEGEKIDQAERTAKEKEETRDKYHMGTVPYGEPMYPNPYRPKEKSPEDIRNEQLIQAIKDSDFHAQQRYDDEKRRAEHDRFDAQIREDRKTFGTN